MPIYDAPLVSKNPVFGFGAGDLHVASAQCAEDGGKVRYLLVHLLPEGGRIGTAEETGRTDGLMGVSTEEKPADLAMYFADERSVDQVLAVLQNVKASFRADSQPAQEAEG